MRRALLLVLSVCSLIACEKKPQETAESDPQAQLEKEYEGRLVDFSAHWLDPDIILVRKAEGVKDIRLHYSLDANIKLSENSVKLNASPSFKLLEIAADPQFAPKFQGFSENYSVVRPEIKVNQGALRLIVKGQVVIVQKDEKGNILRASQVQTSRIIDYLYTSKDNDANEVQDLGATILGDRVQFKVWSPTARSAQVLLFDKDKKPLSPASLEMNLDHNTGIWSALGGSELKDAFYQYQLTLFHPSTNAIETIVATDPYSLSLSTDSLHSQVVDLNDDSTKPENWDGHADPTIPNYEDAILYELHIRDFSASETALENEQARGKYAAFSEKNSHGMRHLKSLKEAGLTHIHLLPTFDLGTINENPENTIYPNDTLEKVCRIEPTLDLCKNEDIQGMTLHALFESFDPTTGKVQEIIEKIRPNDPYNWGYDPFHYTVPEGSYAINPDGKSRIIEFREMVKTLHEMGFRVIMDVVYNHTYEAGLKNKSVLDKIVPNYYHRLNQLSGTIEQSTCCDNTATENAMMAKLMEDSLLVWTKDYRIDGFRFDLMGHQPKNIMLRAYDAVRKIDPDNYFYGEGWNFGEVADNRFFIQATQSELGGTEIGTFSDRLRDAVRGGTYNSSENAIRMAQGYGNGLFTQPNELQNADESKQRYKQATDQIRVGLAGNLMNIPFVDSEGKNVTGKDVKYGDSPTGYALDPADTVNYVSKHDNQTLWDNHQYRIPFDTSTEDRVRMQTMSLALPMLSQGIPFIHMGSELLRSKSFLRDSYDYGDWFNAVDFSKQSNNYFVGLPAAVKDEDNWPLISEIHTKNAGRDMVTPAHIAYSAAIFEEWVRIRSSSVLFRLTTEDDIIERVSFLNTGTNQVPGVIAMKIDDGALEVDLDANYESIIVAFNNGQEAQTLPLDNAQNYQVHPVQKNGADERVKSQASANEQGLVIPPISAVVFVQ